MSMVFPKVKYSVLCEKFQMGSKFHFSQWKTYFSKFIDKLQKFEEMEQLIHHIKFEMRPALYKFPILFSKVNLNLGHKFSPIHL